MSTALIIKNAPEKIGKKNVLSLFGKIQRFGEIDAMDAYVVPGFIDPHEHLIGGDGEGGFANRTPVIQLPEIIRYANGKIFVRDGMYIHDLQYLEQSNRRIDIHDKKATR